MDKFEIGAQDQVKVIGFDMVVVKGDGEEVTIPDALISIAKGELEVLANGEVVGVEDLVQNEIADVSTLENVFLENALSTVEKSADAPSEEEVVIAEEDSEEPTSEERQEALEQQLQRLHELKEEVDARKKELEEIAKEKSEKDTDEGDNPDASVTAAIEAAIQAITEQVEMEVQNAAEVSMEVEEKPSGEDDGDVGQGAAKKAINRPAVDDAPPPSSAGAPPRPSKKSDAEEEPVDPIFLDMYLSGASDSGSKGDAITNVNEGLVYNGTTLPGAQVSLNIDGVVVGATADDSGVWSITFTQALEDGDYEVSATATDASGNSIKTTQTLVIDTVAPDAPTANLSADSDSGASQQDQITNVREPLFEGQAEPNASIQLSIGGRTYETQTDEQGHWQLQVTQSLNAGDYTYDVVAVDVAGNISEAFTSELTIDTESLLTGGLDADSDTGFSQTDNITKDTQPGFSGTAEAGSVIVLQLGTVGIGGGATTTYEVTADDQGLWSITTDQDLPEGLYNYVIQATDIAGNVEEILGDITVDTSVTFDGGLDASSDSGMSSSDGLTNQTTPLFSGSGEPGAVVALSINNQTYTAEVDDDGRWQVQVSDALPEQLHEYELTVTDVAGNTAQASGNITIDITAPTPFYGGLDDSSDSGVSNQDDITNQTQPVFSGSGEVGTMVTLKIAGQTFETEVQGDGTWRFEVEAPLNDGTHAYQLTATDAAGNSKTLYQEVIIDTQVSVEGHLSADSDSGWSDSDAITNQTTPTFNGTADAGASIVFEIDGQRYQAQADEQGHWSVDVTQALSEGAHNYTITATDVAGNQATYQNEITIDTTAPAALTGGLLASSDTGVSQSDGLTNNNQPTFGGQGEPGTQVVLDVAGITYSAMVSADGSWSVDVAEPLDDGQFTYALFATDEAGNQSSPIGGTIEIDTQVTLSGGLSQDTDSGTFNDDAITNDQTPAFNGQSEAGAVVSVTIDGATYSTTADDQGQWRVEVTTPVSEGNHDYILSAVDQAGNETQIKQTLVMDLTSNLEGGLDQDSDSGRSQIDNLTNITTPDFTGVAEAGSEVTLDIAGQTYQATADEQGEWRIRVDNPLAEATHSYTITSVDIAGNTTQTQDQITIDTSAPTPFTGQLSAGSDSGVSDSDQLTNNTTPIFTGTGESGADVTLTIDGQQFSTRVASDGTWQVQVDQPLSDAAYDYTLSSTDAAGNQTQFTGNLVVDTKTNLTAGLDTASDSGVSDSDGITNQTTPSFSGQAEAGAQIALSINNQTYTATADNQGNWQVQVDQALPDGDHAYVVTATDMAGNTADYQSKVTIDTTAPTPLTGQLAAQSDSGQSDSDSITNNIRPVFNGTGEAGASIQLTINNKHYTTDVSSDGTWQLQVTDPLPDGEKTVTITSEDTAGNVSTISDNVTIDTVTQLTGALSGSSDTGLSASDGITNDTTPTFRGTAEAGATVELMINGERYKSTADNNGNWEIEAFNAVPEGEITYTLTATDLAGNEKAIDGMITVDTTAPMGFEGGLDAGSDTGASDQDSITNNQQPSFFGSAEPNALITLNINNRNYSTTVDESGQWNIDVTTDLPEGNRDYTLTATDVAGNQSTLTGTVVVDLTAQLQGGLDSASDTGVSQLDGITKDATPTYSGTAEAGAVVTLTMAGHDYSTVADDNGNWSVDVTNALADGEQAYTLNMVDLAGNTTEQTGTTTIDTSAPALSNVQLTDATDSGVDNDGITNITTPSYMGLAEPNAVVTLTVNNRAYSTTADQAGDWRVDITDALTDATYDVVIMAQDVAGNIAEYHTDLIIDTVAILSGGLDAASDTGRDDQDSITKDDTPTFSGSADPHAQVTLDIGGQTYTAIADETGNWDLNVAHALEDGDYAYQLSTTDAAGNQASQSGEITIDTTTNLTAALTADSDSGTYSDDGITNDTKPSFAGTAEAGSVVVLNINNKNYSTAVAEDGTWRMDVSDALFNGDYDYTVTSTDVAGNESVVSNRLTVDTATQVTGKLDAASDTGVENDDNLTKETQPTFVGTAEAGATIQLVINNQGYQTVADENGNWQVQVTNALPESTHQYTITSTDIAGNTASTSGNIVVDTTALINGGLDASSDTGLSSTDKITNDNMPLFSGTGEPGSTVQLNINNTNYTADVGQDGTWRIQVTDELPEGVRLYTITATDYAGNTATLNGNIQVDTSIELDGQLDAESDTGRSSQDGVTNINTPEFSGTSEVGATVVLTINGQNYSTTVGGDGNWQLTVDSALADGEYSYQVESTDVAGNVVTQNGNIVVDTSIHLTASLSDDSDSGQVGDNVTNELNPVYEGTGEPGAVVTVSVNGANYSATVDGNGDWQVTVANDLPDGDYQVAIRIEDTAGNTQSLTQDLTIDTSIHLTGGLDAASDTGISNQDQITNDNQPKFSGTGEADAVVTLSIDGGTYSTQVDGNGNWSIDVADKTLSDGDYDYTLSITDLAGNSSELSGELTIDTHIVMTANLSADSDTGRSDSDQITQTDTPVFVGTGDAGDTIRLNINGQAYTTSVDDSGQWQLTLPTALTDNQYDYTITATDVAGNQQQVNSTLTVDTTTSVTADLSASSDRGVDNDDNITNDNRPVIEGQAEAEADVVLTIDGQEYTTRADEQGQWFIQVTQTLADGEHAYDVQSTDVAGNVSAMQGNVTIDTSIQLQGGLSQSSDSGVSQVDGVTNNQQPTFEGTGDAGDVVTLDIAGNSYSTVVDPSGEWSIDVQSVLAAQNHSYTLTATDTAGNRTTQGGQITVDVSTSVTGGLDRSSDSGSSDTDQITNDTMPLFSGSGEIGATITLNVDGQQLTTTVGQDGTWQVQVPNALSDGDHAYTVTAVDQAGNQSVISDSVTVDTNIGLNARLDANSDSGISSSDQITNDNTPTFTGNTDGGALVELTINGNSYSQMADDNGGWSIQLNDPLADGDYAYTVTTTDTAGNTTSENSSITIDTLAPTPFTGGLSASSDTGTSDSDQLTKDATPSFSGTGEAGTTVTLHIDNQTYTTSVSNAGTWEITVDQPLADGTHGYQLSSTDVAGNESQLSGNIEIDTQSELSGGLDDASDTGQSQADDVTKETTPRFSGQAESGSAVELTIGGQTYSTTADAQGNWQMTVASPLAEGAHAYQIQATDAAGNASTLNGEITVDTSIDFTGGVDDASDSGRSDSDNITNINTPAFSGTGEANAVVELELDGQTYSTTVDANGEWQMDVPSALADGDYTYTLSSTDVAGNTSTLTDNLTVDTAINVTVRLDAASDTGTSADDGITNNTQPTFSGEAEAGSVVTFAIAGQNFSTTADAQGLWQVTVGNDLAEGIHDFSVTATDIAGNQQSATGSIEVDTSAPMPFTAKLDAGSDSGASDLDGITNNTQPMISGTSEAGSVVSVDIGGQTYSNIVVGDDGLWSVQLNNPLSEGQVNFTATSVDVAGNPIHTSGSFTVDTSTTLDGALSAASDSGVSNSDNITNHTNPIFEGSAEAGAVVTLSIAGNDYSTTVADNGQWQVTVTDALADAQHGYTITTEDVAGNTTSVNGNITIDTTAPTPLTADLASDSGVDSDDNLTNVTTPQFSGTAEADAAITLTIAGQTYQTTADASGNWSVTVTQALADGDHDYQVTATDVAGNQSTTDGSISVDTATQVTGGLDQSSDSGVSDTDNITNQTTPLFSGSGEAGAVVTLSIDGNSYSATVANDGQWFINVSNALAEGNQPYTLTSVDAAGNSASQSGQITVDTTAPTPFTGGLDDASDSGVSNVDDITNDTLPTFSGTAEADSVVTLDINNQTYSVTVDASGQWRIDVTAELPEGDHAYNLTAEDVAGNQRTLNGSVEVDTSISFSGGLDQGSDSGQDSADQLTNHTTPQFSGSGTAGDTISLAIGGNTYTTTVADNGQWQLDVTDPLTDGAQSYTLTASDTAGNTSTRTGEITVDTQAPAVTGGLTDNSDSGSSNSDNLTNVTTPIFGGSGEAGASIQFQIAGQSYTTTVTEAGRWQVAVDQALSEGDHTYEITATDAAGNVSTLTDSITVDTSTTVTVNLDAASDTGTSNADALTKDDTPTFVGTGEAGAVVELSIAGQTYSATVTQGGQWQIDVTQPLSDGDISYQVTSTDAAGNTAQSSGSLVVDTSTNLTGRLSANSDSGWDNQDNITNQTNPNFNGQAEADAIVTLTIDGQSYSTVVDASGQWQINVANTLGEGDHAYTITSMDEAGNQNSVNGSVTVDTSAPTPFTGQVDAASDSGSDSSDQITNQTTPMFSGTGEAGAKVVLSINNQQYETTVANNGTWSVTVSDPLPEGSLSYTLVSSDVAGNTSTITDTMVVDTTAPIGFRGGLDDASDSGTQDDNITNETTPTFSGRGESGAVVSLTINQSTYSTTTDDSGNWSIALPAPLSDDSYPYTITATDTAGNSASVSNTLVIDTFTQVAGGLDAGSDSGDSNSDNLTNVNKPTFSGTGVAGDDIVVLINGQSYDTVVAHDGTWSLEVTQPLADNSYNYSIAATDAAGNTQTLNGSIEVDTATSLTGGLDAASDSGTFSSDGITNDTQPQFTGTGEAGATITLVLNNQTYTTTVGQAGTWQIDVNHALTDGDYSYTLTAQDAAGNSQQQTGNLTIDQSTVLTGGLDVSDDTGRANNDNVTSVNTPTFSGSGEDDAVVNLTIDGQTYSTTVSGGQWQIEVNNILSDGDHSYTISATDVAGNTDSTNGSITVDTVAPASFSGGLSSSSDTGDSNSDDITKNNQPDFSGAGEVGAYVTLNIAGQNYSTVVDAAGNWLINVPNALSDGDYNYTLTTSDLAGNQLSQTGSITVDTATTLVGGLASDSDTGWSNSDDVTKDNTPTFSGTGEAGASITLNIDGNNYTTTVDAGGSWSITTPSLADGTLPYTITARDVAGNEENITGTLVVDTTAPAPFSGQVDAASDTGSSDSDQITNKNKPEFSGQGEAGARITLEVDGRTYSTTVDNDGTWSVNVTVPLNDGDYTYQLVQTDRAGNEIDMSGNVTIDTTLPSVTGSLQASSDTGSFSDDGITSSTQPTFAGTGEAGNVISLSIGGNTYSTTVDAQGNWSTQVTNALNDGDFMYTITATDVAGNVSSVNGNVTVDTSTILTGGLDINSDTGISNSDNITKDNTPNFKGTGEAGSTVELSVGGQSMTTTVDNSGNWAIQVNSPIGDGTYAYTITATDVAGNQSQSTGDITIDTSIPTPFTVELDAASDTGEVGDNKTNLGTPTLSGTGEDGTKVTLSINGQTYTTTVTNAGTWSINIADELESATYTYSVTSTDTAGNEATIADQTLIVDRSIEITGDLDSGSDSGAANNDDITNNTTPTISGMSEANADVSVTINGNTYSTTVAQDGSWSIQVTDALPDGTHSFTIDATDDASNTGSITGSFTVDTAAPNAPSGGLDDQSDLGDSNSDDLTSDTTPLFSGASEANALITLTIAGATYSVNADASGNWSMRVSTPLTEGSHNYSFTATDRAGNLSEATSGSITIDTTPPELDDIRLFDTEAGALVPDWDTMQDTDKLEIRGTTDVATTVRVTIGDEAPITVTSDAGNGTFAVTPAVLPEGNYAVKIEAIDAAGNVITNTQTLKIDRTVTLDGGLDANSDTGVSNTDGITFDTTPTLSGTTDENAVVTIKIDGVVVHSMTADANGNWQYTTTALSDGDHTYDIRAVDTKGNDTEVLGTNLTGTITIDTSAPGLGKKAGLSSYLDPAYDDRQAGDNITTERVVKFVGTGDAGKTVTVKLTDEISFATTVDAQGNWEITTSQLPFGVFDYEVIASDVAGNTRTDTDTITIQPDNIELTLEIAADSDSGTQDDFITSDTTPSLKGTATPGDDVGIVIKNSQDVTVATYTVTPSPIGNFELTLGTALASDSYTLQVSCPTGSLNKTLVIDTSNAVTHQVSDDTMTGDGITNAAVVEIEGTTDPGASVTVRINNKVYTAQAEADGSWAVAIPGLENGVYTYTVSSVDAAGNATGYVEGDPVNEADPWVGSFEMDRSTLEVTSQLDAASDTGVSSTDGITKDNTPTFSGTVSGGEADEMYLEINYQQHAITPDENGDWTLTLPQLADGSYNYKIVAKDAAGNETVLNKSMQIKTDIEFNTKLEGDTGKFNYDYVTNDNQLNFTGQTDPNNTIEAKIYNSIDQLVQTKTVTASNAGAYNVAFDGAMADGQYRVEYVITDKAGNQLTSQIQKVVVDTSVNAVSVVMNENSDTGASNTDGVTNVTNPVFDGTGEPNSTVEVSVKNSAGVEVSTHSVVVSNSGSWSLSLKDLVQDSYQIIAKQTDVAGNVSTTSTYDFRVTTDIPNLSYNITADTNNDGRVTASEYEQSGQQGALTFNGSGDSGDTISLVIAGTEYSTTVNGSGNWSLTTDRLPDYDYPYVLTATNEEGTTNTINDSIIVDSGATIKFKFTRESDTGHLGDNKTNLDKPTFDFTTEKDNEMTLVIKNAQGVEVYNTNFDAPANTFEWQIPNDLALGDGSFSMRVSVSDMAGNSAAYTRTFAIDTTITPIEESQVKFNDQGIADDGKFYTSDGGGEIILTLPQHDAHVVTLYSGDQQIKYSYEVENGQLRLRLAKDVLADGEHNITLKMTDAAGNTTNYTGTLVKQSDLPFTMEIDGFNESSGVEYGPSGTVTVQGTTNAGETVNITFNGNSYSAVADANGDWSLAIADVSDGVFTLSAEVSDKYGNSQSASKVLMVDSVAPELNYSAAGDLDASSDVLWDQLNGTLSGTTSGAAALTIAIDGGSPIDITLEADGSWSYDVTGLVEGEHTVVLTAKDLAGNETSNSFDLVTDVTAPTLVNEELTDATDTGLSQSDGITNVDAPIFAGEGEVGADVSLTIGGNTYTTTVDGAGNWNVAIPPATPLAEGEHTYQLSMTDEAGNTSTDSGTITVDKTAVTTSNIGDVVTADDTPTLLDNIGADEAGALVEVEVDGNTYSTTVDEQGDWSINVDQSLAQGTHEYEVTITDKAGNELTEQHEIIIS